MSPNESSRLDIESARNGKTWHGIPKMEAIAMAVSTDLPIFENKENGKGKKERKICGDLYNPMCLAKALPCRGRLTIQERRRGISINNGIVYEEENCFVAKTNSTATYF